MALKIAWVRGVQPKTNVEGSNNIACFIAAAAAASYGFIEYIDQEQHS